jgi:hypothetical protein
MIANGIVDVVAIQRPLVFEFRVVIHDTANPVAGWRLCRLSRERFLDVLDAAQVDVDADRFFGEQRVTV